MMMPGRKFSQQSGYRYGFNGKEYDNDAFGDGVEQDYGMRVYNSNIGKFLSVDPITKNYPELTPYQFASNTPIQAVDLDGAESMFGWSIGLTPAQAAGAVDGWNQHNNKITNGTAAGIKKSLVNTWGFITSDMWKAQTWKNAAAYVEEGVFDMSSVKVAPSPNIDAQAKDFKDNVINGDAYTRSKYFSEFGTNLLTGYAVSEFFGNLGKFKYSADLPAGTRINGFSLSRMGSNLTKKASEFKLTHSVETITKSADYKIISQLSDEDLIKSVTTPKNYNMVTLNTETGTLFDGNTRIYELQRRNLNVDVPYQQYTPDNSMFPKLKEPPKKP